MDIKEKIDNMPNSCGIYMMRDFANKIIYIGKAKSLKKRVLSHFRDTIQDSPRHISLISQVRNIEYIPTETEKEALLLENELIKYFHPKYNIDYRDDKSYPYLKIDLNREFPRLFVIRKAKKRDIDGRVDKRIRYFGPYPDGSAVRKTSRIIDRYFMLRKCKNTFFNSIKKLNKPERCIYFQMNQCYGPCVGLIKRQSYSRMVRDTSELLSGKSLSLLKRLRKEMYNASKRLDFEKANVFKEQINMIVNLTEKLRIQMVEKEKLGLIKREGAFKKLKDILGTKITPNHIEAFDISNISGEEAVGSMIVFRNGKPANNEYRNFRIKSVKGINDVAMMQEVVRRRYRRLLREKKILPDLIIIDGGKGQINGVLKVLRELDLDDMTVCGLAKREEIIFVPDRKDGIRLERTSTVLNLIRHIRDEAHRFAQRYHKLLRKKRSIES